MGMREWESGILMYDGIGEWNNQNGIMNDGMGEWNTK